MDERKEHATQEENQDAQSGTQAVEPVRPCTQTQPVPKSLFPNPYAVPRTLTQTSHSPTIN